jgi:hypothetical protein
MILMELRAARKTAPIEKAPLLVRLLLTAVAILVVFVAMRAIEVQNEPFEGLYNPGPSQSDLNWDQLTE